MLNPDQVLAAAQTGDRSALERLLAEHRNGVYRYGLRVCRTTEDAEDAVQETLWAATRAIKTFRGTATSIAAWLFTIVRSPLSGGKSLTRTAFVAAPACA